MISTLWISQTAVKFAETELLAAFMGVLFLMWFVVSYKSNEERGVTALFQYLSAGLLLALPIMWNKNTLTQDVIKDVKPKKAKKKTEVRLDNIDRGDGKLIEEVENNQVNGNKSMLEVLGENETKERTIFKNPPPVLVENPKKKQKKGKRSGKKTFCKENTEPTVIKKETKMYESLDVCHKLNRDAKSIYNQLYKHILTDVQLKMNHFPFEGYQPFMQVAAEDSSRQCVRCGERFDIYNGLYLSASECHYHPRRATFVDSVGKVHGCCNLPSGSPPCAVYTHHVTLQHRPRALTKTSSRRHIRKDLQNSIFSLDCEMCYTTDGLEVVRVGLVNINGLAVYEGYVKPKSKILDYNTMYSGVDESHLRNVTVTIDDVKRILASFIHEDTILIGHALNNDLAALGIIHRTIVDTSVLYADPRVPSKKTALRTLASDYLGIKIQDSTSGHDCIDDARASLQLALLKVPAHVPRPVPEEQSPAKQPISKCMSSSTNIATRPHPQILADVQNYYQENCMYEYVQKAQPWNSSPWLYNPNLGCYTLI